MPSFTRESKNNPVIKNSEIVPTAARIEPVAPPGAVYVTEAFASLLAIDRPDDFVCEYVGRVPSAKSFGTMPMHLLRRRWADSARSENDD